MNTDVFKLIEEIAERNGAALGIAGIGSYLGAGLQSAFSGASLRAGRTARRVSARTDRRSSGWRTSGA